MNPTTAVVVDAIVCLPDVAQKAERVAARLGVPCRTIAVRAFPDGESLVTIPLACTHPAIYVDLHRPNAKIMDLLLTADALRDQGARAITLIAPYLPYMRQDRAFHPGEAVSQRTFGKLIAAHFDRVITVDPHLHRTSRLEQALEGKPGIVLSAAAAMAALAQYHGCGRDALVMGPDEESLPMSKAVATALGAEAGVATKQRLGDRAVRMALPEGLRLRGRRIVIVDDIISSGTTLATLASDLKEGGAQTIDVYVTHALCDAGAVLGLHAAGVRYVTSADTIDHPTNGMSMESAIADALAQPLEMRT